LIEAERRLAKLESRFLNESEEGQVLEQVAQAARDEGVRIRDYDKGALTVGSRYSESEVHLWCAAGYPSICRFLHRLSNMPSMVSVSDVTVKTSADKNAYLLDLTLALHFKAQSHTQKIEASGRDAKS
jgi:Tfp pilus assembly protein PilO